MGRNCFQSMCNEWKKTFRAPESFFPSEWKNRKLRVRDGSAKRSQSNRLSRWSLVKEIREACGKTASSPARTPQHELTFALSHPASPAHLEWALFLFEKKGCPTWSPSVKMCYSSQADGKTSLWEHLLAPAIAAKPKTWQLSEQPYHQVYGGCKQLDRWNHLSRPTKPCHDEPTDLQPKGCSSWSATRMRSGKPWLENYLHSSH